MDLEKMLNQRIDILQNGAVITERVAADSRNTIRLLLERKPDVDADRAVMFITHLAMAGQRSEEGKEEKALDKQIIEAVSREPAYPAALEFLEIMMQHTKLKFSDTEREFLAVHLCSLFSQQIL